MLSYRQILNYRKMFVDDPVSISGHASLYHHSNLHEELNLYDHINLNEDVSWNFHHLLADTKTEFLIGSGSIDFLRILDRPTPDKNELRHHDCMWSGRCTTHPDKGCVGVGHKHKLAASSSSSTSEASEAKRSRPDSTSDGDHLTAALQPHLIHNHNPQPRKATVATASDSSIPAGRSLLINSRINKAATGTATSSSSASTVAAKHPALKLPTVSTNDFLKEREFIARPDTPLSLDDDPPEFKHSIDLAACTMGSNKVHLLSGDVETPTEIINMLKEHLEDATTTGPMHIRSRFTNFLPDTKTELTDLLDDIQALSDFEEMGDSADDDGGDEEEVDEEEEEEEDDEDEEEDSGEDSDVDMTIAPAAPVAAANTITTHGSMSVAAISPASATPSIASSTTSSQSSSSYDFTQSMHSDHSYTRSKNNRVDVIGLGVQTPSDSEEEIDVVSVGDKTLPTNPTAKDRRALQTTVAHKISARIVHTPNNASSLHHLHQQQQHHNVSSSKPGPIIISGGIKTLLPRRAPNTIDDHTRPVPTTMTVKYATIPGASGAAAHKRPHQVIRGQDGKRYRTAATGGTTGGKKIGRSPVKQRASNASDEVDESDTIEKRNLHNDMERQRRIGLKNLFEELKYQIPSLKDKERAPKVSILREAANLCRKYQREEEERAALKKMQAKLYNRVSVLRTSLAAQRSATH